MSDVREPCYRATTDGIDGLGGGRGFGSPGQFNHTVLGQADDRQWGLGLDLGLASGPSPALGLGSALGSAPECEAELDAIRGSVRRMREQRAAVERLQENSIAQEQLVQMLKARLQEASNRIEELQASGGQEKVWQLEYKVSELSARVQAQETMLHTQEQSLAEGQQALQRAHESARALQARVLPLTQKLEEQADTHRREVETLSKLLREARAALGASRSEMEGAVASQGRELDRARLEKETLMSRHEEVEGRAKELVLLCERQRAALAEAQGRANEQERAGEAARRGNEQKTLENQELELQVADLKKALMAAHHRMKEEDSGTAAQLQAVAREAEGLAAQLSEARAEAAAKDEQLRRHRDEMLALRGDVVKLKEVASQQAAVRRALRERDEAIQALRAQLERERRERGEWARVRADLLSQFVDEEHKLRSTLSVGPLSHAPTCPRRSQPLPPPPPQQQHQQQEQERSGSESGQAPQAQPRGGGKDTRANGWDTRASPAGSTGDGWNESAAANGAVEGGAGDRSRRESTLSGAPDGTPSRFGWRTREPG